MIEGWGQKVKSVAGSRAACSGWRLPMICLVYLVAALGVSGVPASGSENKLPNVVLMMADDMGYECLGCNGSTYRTPHLDRLAADGLRFEHCYSQPLCTPSRIKIMTGKYNFRNYIEFGYLHPEERTFGHLLQAAGYRTCIAGKWQLNGIAYGLPGSKDTARPRAAGFDRTCLWQVTKQKKLGERYADPLIEVDGEVRPHMKGKYGPQVFADFVCDFIEENREQPFFVYFPMVLTHDPFVPTPDTAEWSSGDRYQDDPKFFGDMVTYADKVVGQIDAKLEEVGVRENTILIFTADNGTHSRISTPMHDGRVVVGGKGTMPNAGTHVPMVVSWPGTAPAGKVQRDLIDFSDFYATLADVAGVAATEAGESGDGRSFLPQLRGEVGNPRRYAICHYDPRWGQLGRHRGRYVRDQVYKLYLDGRLYNVPGDVLEQHPLPESTETAANRAQLQAVLDELPEWNPQPKRPYAPDEDSFKLP